MEIDRFTPVRSLKVGDRIGRNKIVYIDDRSIVAESANGRFTVVDINGESLSDVIVLKHNIKRLSEAMDYAKTLGGRELTVAENKSNKTSIYKGVTRAGYGWQAQMSIEGVYTYLGHFFTEIEAARAYNKKAMEIYNDKAYTNPLPGDSDFGVRKPFDSRYGTGGKAGRFIDPNKLKGKTSKYKGVYWDETYQKWFVDIDRKDLKYRKSFEEEIDAAKDYNKVIRDKYGDNAIFNDIPEEENKMDNEHKYKGVSTVTGSDKFRAQI